MKYSVDRILGEWLILVPLEAEDPTEQAYRLSEFSSEVVQVREGDCVRIDHNQYPYPIQRLSDVTKKRRQEIEQLLQKLIDKNAEL